MSLRKDLPDPTEPFEEGPETLPTPDGVVLVALIILYALALFFG